MGIFLSKDIDRAVLQEFRDAGAIPEDIDMIYRTYKAFQRRRIKTSIYGVGLDLKAFAALLNGHETNNLQKYRSLFHRWSKMRNKQSMKHRLSRVSSEIQLSQSSSSRSMAGNVAEKAQVNSESLLNTLRSNRQLRKHTKNNFNPTETVDALEFFVAWTLVAQVPRGSAFNDEDSSENDDFDAGLAVNHKSTTTSKKVSILLKYFDSGSSVDLVSMTALHKCAQYMINALITLHNLKSGSGSERVRVFDDLYKEALKLIFDNNDMNYTQLTLATSKYCQMKFARGNLAIWAMTNPIILKVVNLDLLANVHNNSQLNEVLLKSNDVKWLLNLYHGRDNAKLIFRKMKVTAQHFDPMIDHFDYIRLPNGEKTGLDDPDAHEENGAKRVIFDLHFNPFLTLKYNTRNSKLMHIQKQIGNHQTLSVKDSINMITGRHSNIDLRSILNLNDPLVEETLQHGLRKPFTVRDPVVGSISTAYTVSIDSNSSTFSLDHDNGAVNDPNESSMSLNSNIARNTMDLSEDGTAIYSQRSSKTKLAKSQSELSLVKPLKRDSGNVNQNFDNDMMLLRRHKFSRKNKRKSNANAAKTSRLSKSKSTDIQTLMDSGTGGGKDTSQNGVRQEASIVQHYDGTMPFDAPPVSLVEFLANFSKHKKLAIKIQSEIRSPEMVTPDNVQSIVRAFKSLSSGKEKIAKDHFVNSFKAIDSSLNSGKDTRISEKAHWAERIRNQKIRATLTRIFEKCDDDHTDFVDINEFLIHQFDNANEEEVDRAIAYTGAPPSVKAWAARYLKILFEKLSRTYHSNRKIYSRSKKHYLDREKAQFVIHENEPMHEQEQAPVKHQKPGQFHLPLPAISQTAQTNNRRQLSARPLDKSYRDFGKSKGQKGGVSGDNSNGSNSVAMAATAEMGRDNNFTTTFDESGTQLFSTSHTVHASHYLQNRGTKATVLGNNAGYHPQITNEMSIPSALSPRSIETMTAKGSQNGTGFFSGRSVRKLGDTSSFTMTNMHEGSENVSMVPTQTIGKRVQNKSKKKHKKRFKAKQPRVAMNELFALCVHCKELREFVLRWTRIARSRFRKMVTFEEAMDIIFEKCQGYNKDISKLTRDSNVIPSQSTIMQLAMNSDNINLSVFGANLLQFDNTTDAFSNPQLLAVWAYGPFPSLSDVHTQDLKRLFDSIEQFSDCSISVQQLSNVYEWIIPQSFDSRILSNLFYRFDCNPNMRIRFKDFKELFGLLYSEFVREFQKRSVAKMTHKSKFLKRFTVKIAKRRASRMMLVPSEEPSETICSPSRTTKNTNRSRLTARKEKTSTASSVKKRSTRPSLKKQFSIRVKKVAKEMLAKESNQNVVVDSVPHTPATAHTETVPSVNALKEHVEMVHDLKDTVYQRMIDNSHNQKNLGALRQAFGSFLQVNPKMSKTPGKINYVESNLENFSQNINATVKKNTTQSQLIAQTVDSTLSPSESGEFDEMLGLKRDSDIAHLSSLRSTANTRERDRAHVDWFWGHMLRKPTADAAWESLIILATLMQDVDRRSAKQEMIMPLIDVVQAFESLKTRKAQQSMNDDMETEQYGPQTADYEGNTISSDIDSHMF